MSKMYFKLGITGATLFVDPKAKVKITKNQPVEVEKSAYLTSPKMVDAKKHGHIILITKEQYDAILEGKNEEEEVLDDKPDFSSMDKDQILNYLNEEYDLKEEEMDRYSGMKLQALRKEVEKLEADNKEG